VTRRGGIPNPPNKQDDFCLPDVGVVKLVGKTTGGKLAILATKSGHNDGHHSHTDIATFIINIGSESLIRSGARFVQQEYFRRRCDNLRFVAHGARSQAPGPEFGGSRQFYGKIVEYGQRDAVKYTVIDFNRAYDIPELVFLRRTLELNANTGVITLMDEFEFEGDPLTVEEAFSTWFPVDVDGRTARILGAHTTLELAILEPAGEMVFAAEALTEDCRANKMDEILTRLAVVVPKGAKRFKMQMTPVKTFHRRSQRTQKIKQAREKWDNS
jgi:hypothetical protein